MKKRSKAGFKEFRLRGPSFEGLDLKRDLTPMRDLAGSLSKREADELRRKWRDIRERWR